MITLATTNTFQGKAGTATAVSYTIYGDEIATGVDSFKVLGQGQFASSTGVLYTVPAATQTLIKKLDLANTTASPVTGITFYVNGTAAANQINGGFTIPANGSATYDDQGVFRVYDSSGLLVSTTSVTLTGDVTGIGAGTIVTTLATVNSNVGTFGTSANVSTFTVNGKGLITAASNTAIQSASTSQAGFESAAQFNTTANQWYDVTNYGVSISNSGATNVSAMNTLIQTTAPGPSRFYFPDTGANYPMTGTITITHSGQTFMGAGMRSSVIFVANTTQDLFSITDTITNITFQDLGFWSIATATAGSVINCGTVSGTGNQQVNMYRCGMEGFGGNHFNGFLFNGTRGGEVSNIEDCVLNSFRGYGVGVVGNTTVPNTTSALTMTNVLMNGSITGTTGAIAGIYQQQCGALQINSCDIIQCTNNLLTAPITSTSQVVASIYAINTYFDASHGSCVKLGGTQPTVRCKFVSCSMTISADAAANYSAIEFSNTATNPPGDIDILNCNVQNTFNNTATTNGILLTAAANVKIIGNNINGFTNNLQASAAASSATKLNIVGNSFGPGTVTASTSTNDILLNAGTYGYVQITDNVFAPTSPFQTTSTTHLNDASTVSPATYKNIANNIGLVSAGAPATLPTATTTVAAVIIQIAGASLQLPTNGLRPGNRFRWHLTMTKTAGTVTNLISIKYGTANSTADGTISSLTSGTNTALADTMQAIIDINIATIGSGTSATVTGAVQYFHTVNTAATGFGGLPTTSLVGGITTNTAFNSTLAIPFLSLAFTGGTGFAGTAIGWVEVIA